MEGFYDHISVTKCHKNCIYLHHVLDICRLLSAAVLECLHRELGTLCQQNLQQPQEISRDCVAQLWTQFAVVSLKFLINQTKIKPMLHYWFPCSLAEGSRPRLCTLDTKTVLKQFVAIWIYFKYLSLLTRKNITKY